MNISKPVADGLAFLFDLDGVVVDSNTIHTECWRLYIRDCGLVAPDGFVERMFGRRNDDIVRDLLGADAPAGEVFRLGAEKEALYRRMMKPVLHKHLVPGVVEFLKRHRDVPKGVASNAEPANVEFVLAEAGVRDLFRVVTDGHQVARPKPFPDIYLRTAELLGVEPANCIVFEDSYSGIEAAVAAGMRTVGIRTTHPELSGVDLAINHFLDPRLEKWLGSQKPVC